MPKTTDLLEEIAVLKAMLIAADARDKPESSAFGRSNVGERINQLPAPIAAG